MLQRFVDPQFSENWIKHQDEQLLLQLTFNLQGVEKLFLLQVQFTSFLCRLIEPKHFFLPMCRSGWARWIRFSLVILQIGDLVPQFECIINEYTTCIHQHHFGSTFFANHNISKICIIRGQLGYSPQGFLCIFLYSSISNPS